MPMKRTSIVLDDPSRAAARELATQWECTVSEAIRRAVVLQRDAAAGVPEGRRAERLRALLDLAELFEGHDAAAEVARLKREDEFG
jgi:hypothetical protein